MMGKLIDGDKAQAVLKNMAEHLLEAGNPEMAGAVGYAAEVIGNQKAVDAIRVPCKPGQTIWEVVLFRDKRVSHINPMTVVGVHAGDFPSLRGHKRKNYLVVTYPTSELLGRVPFNKIGKTVFLTKEDAERAAYPCEYCFSGAYRSCDGCSHGERRSNDNTAGS